MAAGSHATFDGYPNHCHYAEWCLYGGRVLITGVHSLWFETDVLTGETRSYHVDCWRALSDDRPSLDSPAPTGRPRATAGRRLPAAPGGRRPYSSQQAEVQPGVPRALGGHVNETPAPTEPDPEPEGDEPDSD